MLPISPMKLSCEMRSGAAAPPPLASRDACILSPAGHMGDALVQAGNEGFSLRH